MDPSPSPLTRVGQTIWTILSYVTGVIARYLRAEPETTGNENIDPEPEDTVSTSTETKLWKEGQTGREERVNQEGEDKEERETDRGSGHLRSGADSGYRHAVAWEQCKTSTVTTTNRSTQQFTVKYFKGVDTDSVIEEGQDVRTGPTDQRQNETTSHLFTDERNKKDIERQEGITEPISQQTTPKKERGGWREWEKNEQDCYEGKRKAERGEQKVPGRLCPGEDGKAEHEPKDKERERKTEGKHKDLIRTDEVNLIARTEVKSEDMKELEKEITEEMDEEEKSDRKGIDKEGAEREMSSKRVDGVKEMEVLFEMERMEDTEDSKKSAETGRHGSLGETCEVKEELKEEQTEVRNTDIVEQKRKGQRESEGGGMEPRGGEILDEDKERVQRGIELTVSEKAGPVENNDAGVERGFLVLEGAEEKQTNDTQKMFFEGQLGEISGIEEGKDDEKESAPVVESGKMHLPHVERLDAQGGEETVRAQEIYNREERVEQWDEKKGVAVCVREIEDGGVETEENGSDKKTKVRGRDEDECKTKTLHSSENIEGYADIEGVLLLREKRDGELTKKETELEDQSNNDTEDLPGGQEEVHGGRQDRGIIDRFEEERGEEVDDREEHNGHVRVKRTEIKATLTEGEIEEGVETDKSNNVKYEVERETELKLKTENIETATKMEKTMKEEESGDQIDDEKTEGEVEEMEKTEDDIKEKSKCKQIKVETNWNKESEVVVESKVTEWDQGNIGEVQEDRGIWERENVVHNTHEGRDEVIAAQRENTDQGLKVGQDGEIGGHGREIGKNMTKDNIDGRGDGTMKVQEVYERDIWTFGVKEDEVISEADRSIRELNQGSTEKEERKDEGEIESDLKEPEVEESEIKGRATECEVGGGQIVREILLSVRDDVEPIWREDEIRGELESEGGKDVKAQVKEAYQKGETEEFSGIEEDEGFKKGEKEHTDQVNIILNEERQGREVIDERKCVEVEVQEGQFSELVAEGQEDERQAEQENREEAVMEEGDVGRGVGVTVEIEAESVDEERDGEAMKEGEREGLVMTDGMEEENVEKDTELEDIGGEETKVLGGMEALPGEERRVSVNREQHDDLEGETAGEKEKGEMKGKDDEVKEREVDSEEGEPTKAQLDMHEEIEEKTITGNENREREVLNVDKDTDEMRECIDREIEVEGGENVREGQTPVEQINKDGLYEEADERREDIPKEEDRGQTETGTDKNIDEGEVATTWYIDVDEGILDVDRNEVNKREVNESSKEKENGDYFEKDKIEDVEVGETEVEEKETKGAAIECEMGRGQIEREIILAQTEQVEADWREGEIRGVDEGVSMDTEQEKVKLAERQGREVVDERKCVEAEEQEGQFSEFVAEGQEDERQAEPEDRQEALVEEGDVGRGVGVTVEIEAESVDEERDDKAIKQAEREGLGMRDGMEEENVEKDTELEDIGGEETKVWGGMEALPGEERRVSVDGEQHDDLEGETAGEKEKGEMKGKEYEVKEREVDSEEGEPTKVQWDMHEEIEEKTIAGNENIECEVLNVDKDTDEMRECIDREIEVEGGENVREGQTPVEQIYKDGLYEEADERREDMPKEEDRGQTETGTDKNIDEREVATTWYIDVDEGILDVDRNEVNKREVNESSKEKENGDYFEKDKIEDVEVGETGVEEKETKGAAIECEMGRGQIEREIILAQTEQVEADWREGEIRGVDEGVSMDTEQEKVKLAERQGREVVDERKCVEAEVQEGQFSEFVAEGQEDERQAEQENREEAVMEEGDVGRGVGVTVEIEAESVDEERDGEAVKEGEREGLVMTDGMEEENVEKDTELEDIGGEETKVWGGMEALPGEERRVSVNREQHDDLEGETAGEKEKGEMKGKDDEVKEREVDSEEGEPTKAQLDMHEEIEEKTITGNENRECEVLNVDKDTDEMRECIDREIEVEGGENVREGQTPVEQINKDGLYDKTDTDVGRVDVSKENVGVREDEQTTQVDGKTEFYQQLDTPSLDFTAQKSRIALKNPLTRRPKDPRTLLHIPSLSPTPLTTPQPEQLNIGPVGVKVGGAGTIGIRLPGIGGGLPVLKKTQGGVKERENVTAQNPDKELISSVSDVNKEPRSEKGGMIGVKMGGIGAIGVKLPAFSTGLPVLRKTGKGIKMRETPEENMTSHSDREGAGVVKGVGIPAVKLPGFGPGFPVLRKTERGVKIREDTEGCAQKSEVEENVSDKGPQERLTKTKPKWTPPGKAGIGAGSHPVMAELKNKLEKTEE
ncbi:uncharacterized protein si:ch211-136m16.8 isoform X2 [Megalops cyprinoides]|uniref:uncharacterized protein si:ch211-136m16.8 isoform X2 n=1 Tax=Megalops cyprinoides TaxID=118141 RepID=UPI0018653416|nr:uncharacterized protein si:ch211-136m16.8 isoform X2 [Megalops cyprinoides]